jgi:hypothetical protein
MRRQAIIAALLIVGVGVVLGATVFRADIAQATGLDKQATPVREINLDADRNIRVHEQGTARVNVTNSSLPVAPAAPISAGGYATSMPVSATPQTLISGEATASALSIRLSPEVSFLLLSSDDGQAALFYGPAYDGNGSIVLALTRPVTFDTVHCSGGAGGRCSVSWVGNSP